jgi:hypothetical protein
MEKMTVTQLMCPQAYQAAAVMTTELGMIRNRNAKHPDSDC